MKRLLLIFTGHLLFLSASTPQNVSISGTPNHYLKVDSVLTNKVLVTPSAELSFFQPGDKVLLIQMTGGTQYGPETYPNFKTKPVRARKEYNNSGRFEILQVDEVITGTDNYVVFTDDISNGILDPYDSGEKIQLVRLVEGDNVTVTGLVQPKKWDGSTGGIVAILGMDSVILKDNINANFSGFRGGIVPEDFTAGCRTDISGAVVDTLYFLPSELNRSGNKGEGIITTGWPYTRGTAFALNGGGAGNGFFSGGAGGGNFRAGGDGGLQSAACTDPLGLKASWGGYGCYDLYLQSTRVIMGGGGGTGLKSSTKTATNGGDGGGIAIIITGTLAGGGYTISASGQTVSNPATGSGGGGGAGGGVLLDVTDYYGSLSVKLRGGNGGQTTGTPCTGSGGGGSGGVLWHSGTSITGVAVDTLAGSPGAGCFSNIGNGGFYGTTLKNLITPLTGFLFNSIRGTDTICAGQIPGMLTGSQPKGGDGAYTWQWEQSTDKVNWSSATGSSALRTLLPPVLTQTTWYRRIVNSDIISDTSRILEVYVYPAISNNSISGTDTICFDLQSKTLTGSNPAGGDSNYQYQWQFSTNQSTWIQGGTDSTYSPGRLQHTRYYRRIVNSTAYCSHISNTVKITVLQSITGNVFISPDTVICVNQETGPLNAGTPANGDGIYSYEWQFKSVAGNWTNIPSSNVLRYDPGIPEDTTLYRRIVFSGNDRACRDTSAAKSIHVLPALSDNLVATDTSRYCAGKIPWLINGSQPSGGDGSYAYQWREQTSGNWNLISGAILKDFAPDQAVETDTRFSRIVTSGKYDACRDTSVAVTLVVVPHIHNALVLADQTICENSTPAALNPLPSTGGLGDFIYQWRKLEQGGSQWADATGTADQVSYVPGILTVTTLFTRKVSSDICSQISDTVKVTVYPSIGNNSIPGGPVQYTCYNSPKALSGSVPVNGNGSYAFQWEQSSNNSDWAQTTINTGTAQDYLTPDLTNTRYYRRVVYSSPLNRECADTSIAVEIRINPLPTGDVIPSLDTLCAGETLYVKFNTAGINPPYAVTIGNQTKTGVTASIDSIALVPDITQFYSMVSIEDDSGCMADLSGNIGLAKAVIYQIPVADAGTDKEICGNTCTLQAVKSVPGSYGSWSAPYAIFTDPANQGSNVTIDHFGTNLFTWTETNWHCANSDQVKVIFYQQPEVPDAGPDQVLDFTFTTQLQAVHPSAGSGKWTVTTGTGTFNNDTLVDAIVSELANSNTLQWTVHNGICPEVSDIVDILIDPLVIAKGFTPNGDTKNDYFDLGATTAERIKIKIFNAAGILVFESDDYQNDHLWDGKNMNGVELPEGTYFYIAEVKMAGKEKEFQFRSFVEILR